MVENVTSWGQVSGRFTVTPAFSRIRANSFRSSSVSSMIRCGKGPRGMSASERSGNSASCVLTSGVGYRAFSGLPTMTSSSGSHSLQLQTRDMNRRLPTVLQNLTDLEDHTSNLNRRYQVPGLRDELNPSPPDGVAEEVWYRQRRAGLYGFLKD